MHTPSTQVENTPESQLTKQATEPTKHFDCVPRNLTAAFDEAPTRCNTDEHVKAPKRVDTMSKVPKFKINAIQKPDKGTFDFEKLLETKKFGTTAKPEQTHIMFACEYCDRKFNKTQSLGGHISKKHPGKSASYQ